MTIREWPTETLCRWEVTWTVGRLKFRRYGPTLEEAMKGFPDECR